MVGRINIIGDEHLKLRDDGGTSITFNDRVYQKSICICPNGMEHFDSTDLLKLRLACDQDDIKIITHGRSNYLPFYSIFADEAVFYDGFLPAPSYYGDGFTHVQNECSKLPNELWRHLIYGIQDKQVVERFWDWNVSILDSAYRTWQSQILRHNLTIFEVKMGGCINPILKALDVIGAEQKFQQSLLQRVGVQNYMSCQLLCSHLLNWCYVCCGGASNLFSVLPMRVALLCDHNIKDNYDLLKAMYSKRYGKSELIMVHRENAWEPLSAGIICREWDVIQRNAEEIKKLPPPEVISRT
jgi:hypothetical protein